MTAPGRLLIIQIPCFNEAGTLAITLAALPRQLPGFARVEWLIIDDGSTDRTAEIARAAGADHILHLGRNRGLARAFTAGLAAALELGADVIVNTDADNQYCASDIPKLLEPLVTGDADLVIGARPIADTPHFSALKKALQRLGSKVVRHASRTAVVDASSGFRAFSRAAALRLRVHGAYTYTLETVIQAGSQGLNIASVPIRTNPDLRPSRLVRSIPSYVLRSAGTIMRSRAIYWPARMLLAAAAATATLGLASLALHAWLAPSADPALALVGAILLGTGPVLGALALIADLIAINRHLLEKLLLAERDAAARDARIQRLPIETEPSHSHASAA